MFIWILKSIEFHLPHYEIPQLSRHYCTLAHILLSFIMLRKISDYLSLDSPDYDNIIIGVGVQHNLEKFCFIKDKCQKY